MSELDHRTERVVWGNSVKSETLGAHSLWGVSPAQDLLSPVPASAKTGMTTESDGTLEPIRVLLVSPGDLRDVLVTLRERRFGEASKMERPLHFYVHESCLEVMARHLLLMGVALDFEKPVRQRAALYLELLGNLLIQERAASQVESVGEALAELAIQASADSATDTVLGCVVDLHELRFRERDVLVDAFRAWRTSTPAPDVEDLWNRRMRSHLGARYDARDGAFDWDYRVNLVRAGASLVHGKQYRQWRETGVAFEFGDRKYDVPNRTFLTFQDGLMKKGPDRGEKRQVKGYWGDTVIGPYLGFGIESDQDSLHRVVDRGTGTERHRHNATVVAAYNLVRCFWTWETGARYHLRAPDDIYSGIGVDADASVDDAQRQWRRQALARADNIVASFEGVKLVALAGDPTLIARKHANRFDVVALGLSSSHLLQTLQPALKPGANLLVEAARFVLPLTLQQRRLYVEKVHSMALAAGLDPAYPTQSPRDYDDPAIDNLLGQCDTAPADLDVARLAFTKPL